jgi:hypothetical protein
VSDAEEPTQIPVDAPHAEDRVDMVPPVMEEESSSDSGTSPTAAAEEFTEEHPEALVAGAFMGAFLFAKLLQRIGGNR